jgi:hypothetical protein
MSSRPTAVAGLVVDEVDWARAGDDLRRVDPIRYVQLLQLARRIVLAHTDPLATPAVDTLKVERKGSA